MSKTESTKQDPEHPWGTAGSAVHEARGSRVGPTKSGGRR